MRCSNVVSNMSVVSKKQFSFQVWRFPGELCGLLRIRLGICYLFWSQDFRYTNLRHNKPQCVLRAKWGHRHTVVWVECIESLTFRWREGQLCGWNVNNTRMHWYTCILRITHTQHYIVRFAADIRAGGLDIRPLGHYSDVIMGAMASQITSLTIVYSTVNSRRRSTKTSKAGVTGLCEGNSAVTGEFPAQMVSNAEDISIWWRHHGHHGGLQKATSHQPWWSLMTHWLRVSSHMYRLTHSPMQDKRPPLWQTTLSNAFSWMKIIESRFKFQWNLLPAAQLTISQHWFR